jgi:hypothetical protein
MRRYYFYWDATSEEGLFRPSILIAIVLGDIICRVHAAPERARGSINS